MWAVLCGTAIQSPSVITREQALKTIPLEKELVVRQSLKNNSGNPSKSVNSNNIDQNENHEKRTWVNLLLVQKLNEPLYTRREGQIYLSKILFQ